MSENIFEILKQIPNEIRRPYISYIRFPFYKKLNPNARIDFEYPITAIVGCNGSSKSSILRAIYGSPENKSISEYWFETGLDYIEDKDPINNNKPKSAFIYGYYNSEAGNDVEVIKTRVNLKNKPDYWEPSRPIISYNMAPMPEAQEPYKGRFKTRWKLIEKNIVYLDFRHEAISAFDKYFYSGKLIKTKRLQTKQDFIRARSKYLKEIINKELKTYEYYGKNRLKENKILSDEVVSKISKILGKKYSGIRIIEHEFFTEFPEKTVYLCTDDFKYSEAFAGSGEFAVISLVQKVMEATEKSLIILDEPEVSLHPASQEQLLLFLAEQTLEKKHQVVFSTHSPALIKFLPSNAIKLLSVGLHNEINILNNLHPEQAFIKIGWKPDKKTIIVEDKAAKQLIEIIVKKNDMSENIDVMLFPGGAEQIINGPILSNAIVDSDKILYFLDGDKRKEHKNSADIPENKLDEAIRMQTGCNIKIPCSGRSGTPNLAEKILNQKKFLDYYKKFVFYLPKDTPEEIVWTSISEDVKQGISNTDYKECFRILSKKELDKDDSVAIEMTLRRYIVNNKILLEGLDCLEIISIIKNFF